MGRNTKYTVGSVHGGFEVVEGSSPYKGTNRMIPVKCLACGTVRTVWNSVLHSGKVKCQYCNSGSAAFANALEGDRPIIAVYASHLDIFWPGDALPKDVPLFQFVTKNLATIYKPQTAVIPKPDHGRPYLVVPAAWVKYFCEDESGNLPTDEQLRADTYYDEHVTRSTPSAYSTHLQGSGVKWKAEGTEWAYLYWKDTKTWPNDQPPAIEAVPVAQAVRAVEPVHKLKQGEGFPVLGTSKQDIARERSKVKTNEAKDALFEAQNMAGILRKRADKLPMFTAEHAEEIRAHQEVIFKLQQDVQNAQEGEQMRYERILQELENPPCSPTSEST